MARRSELDHPVRIKQEERPTPMTDSFESRGDVAPRLDHPGQNNQHRSTGVAREGTTKGGGSGGETRGGVSNTRD